MAITLSGPGGVSNQNGDGSNTYTFASVDIGTPVNGLLTVNIALLTVGQTRTITGVTWNGAALSKAVSLQRDYAGGSLSHETAIFYLSNPDPGMHDVVVTTSAVLNTSARLHIGVDVFQGAHQTQAFVQDQDATGSGFGDPSVAITPTEDGELIIAVYMSETGQILTPAGSPATAEALRTWDMGSQTGGSSFVIQTTSGLQTMAYTGLDDEWTMSVGSFRSADPGGGAVSTGVSGLIEMCFGGSFRRWLKDRGTAVRHWWLGDVQTTEATDDINESTGTGAFGTYAVVPTKARGLLPEYGLSTAFDGTTQKVSTVSGLANTGGSFSLLALVRPAAGGLGAAQCIYQTGGTGSAYLGLNATNNPVFGVTGGTKVTSSVVIEAGHEYLIVGSYDSTDARICVGELLVEATVTQTGPTALTFTADHSLGTIGANESTEFFEGDLQSVAELEEVLLLAEVQELHATAVWTDVTPDVEGTLTIDRGIHDDSPLARIAATGQLRLTMDNSHLNSAELEGYYSPQHANVRAGFTKGIPIRVRLQDPGSPTEFPIQFIGSIRSIRPSPGVYRDRRVAVLATDWLDEAARTTLKALPVLTSVTADAVVGHLVNVMRNRPHAISFQTGSDTYVRALHNTTDEKTTAQAELLKVSQSELGLIYVLGDGTLVFEARSTRAVTAEIDHTLDDFLDVDQDDHADSAKNLVKVTVHPSRLGNDPFEILHSTDALSSPADPAIQVDNGIVMELFLPYRDLLADQTTRIGGVDVIEPLPTTDYLLNTAEDGTGTDVTGNSLIEVSWRVGGNGVYVTIENQYGQRVWFTFLRVRGRAVYDYEPITAISKYDRSIDAVGEQEVAIDMPYQNQAGIGQGTADFLVNALRDLGTRIKTVSFWGDYSETHRQAMLYGDISSRIEASETMAGLSSVEYHINSKRIVWKPSGDQGPTDIDVTFGLALASTQQFWILEESALDQTTRLAYF